MVFSPLRAVSQEFFKVSSVSHTQESLFLDFLVSLPPRPGPTAQPTNHRQAITRLTPQMVSLV